MCLMIDSMEKWIGVNRSGEKGDKKHNCSGRHVRLEIGGNVSEMPCPDNPYGVLLCPKILGMCWMLIRPLYVPTDRQGVSTEERCQGFPKELVVPRNHCLFPTSRQGSRKGLVIATTISSFLMNRAPSFFPWSVSPRFSTFTNRWPSRITHFSSPVFDDSEAG